VYLFYVALKAYGFGRKANRESRSADNRDADEMVLDPQCQMYIPKGEAVLQDGKYFCSQECAKLFLSR
jgi:hypothetical protein